jgi:flavin reductase (DIM6/NTAB) family NADH-FMN oxidoreductase RutF
MMTQTVSQSDQASKEAIGKAIGRLPSGVSIITAGTGDQKAGMMASWIQQAGFEPPALMIAIHPDRHISQVIAKTGQLIVNIIPKGDKTLMKAFGKASDNPFEGLSYEECSQGSGIVLKDAVAALSCRVLEKVSATDHQVLVAEVQGAQVLNTDQEPFVHLRDSGFHY